MLPPRSTYLFTPQPELPEKSLSEALSPEPFEKSRSRSSTAESTEDRAAGDSSAFADFAPVELKGVADEDDVVVEGGEEWVNVLRMISRLGNPIQLKVHPILSTLTQSFLVCC